MRSCRTPARPPRSFSCQRPVSLFTSFTFPAVAFCELYYAPVHHRPRDSHHARAPAASSPLNAPPLPLPPRARSVRDYHNAFVNRLLQMQEVLASLPPDSNTEQRLQGWREAAPRYDVNATGPTAPPAPEERGRKRSRGGRSDKWRQLAAAHSDLLLAAVRALLESWPKAYSQTDVLMQLNGQMGTLGLVGMEPATVLECLGVVMVSVPNRPPLRRSRTGPRLGCMRVSAHRAFRVVRTGARSVVIARLQVAFEHCDFHRRRRRSLRRLGSPHFTPLHLSRGTRARRRTLSCAACGVRVAEFPGESGRRRAGGRAHAAGGARDGGGWSSGVAVEVGVLRRQVRTKPNERNQTKSALEMRGVQSTPAQRPQETRAAGMTNTCVGNDILPGGSERARRSARIGKCNWTLRTAARTRRRARPRRACRAPCQASARRAPAAPNRWARRATT